MVSVMKKEILIVLPTFADTKDSKRIKLLRDSGFKVNVAYFERDNFLARKPEADSFFKLGKIEDGKYLKRIIVYLKSVLYLRKLAKKNDLIYNIGADLAIFSFVSAIGLEKKTIIDVADIRSIQVSRGIFGWVLRKLESYVTRKSSLVVVTSMGFVNNYYIEKLKLNRLDFFLLENKVDYTFENKTLIKNEQLSKIVLGYFGVIRDWWTLRFIERVVNTLPNKFEAVVAGINLLGEVEFNRFLNTNSKVKYLGPYVSPNDLANIYSQVDVMLVFYPDMNSSKEWFEAKRICRSNRFYEALLFVKPLLAFSFSDDGKEVEKWGVGLTLDNYDFDDSVEKIFKEINCENVEKWKKNIMKMPAEVFQFSDEGDRLAMKLREIIRK
jgi:succinoglycan biosynthesis protein ExoL